jgi:hypothetical protein
MTLALKIKFLEEVLVPSFGVGLTNDAMREVWMKKRSHETGRSRWECGELMLLFNFIKSFQEAEAELQVREQRAFILQQQLAGTLHFNLFLHDPSLIFLCIPTLIIYYFSIFSSTTSTSSSTSTNW